MTNDTRAGPGAGGTIYVDVGGEDGTTVATRCAASAALHCVPSGTRVDTAPAARRSTVVVLARDWVEVATPWDAHGRRDAIDPRSGTGRGGSTTPGGPVTTPPHAPSSGPRVVAPALAGGIPGRWRPASMCEWGTCGAGMSPTAPRGAPIVSKMNARIMLSSRSSFSHFAAIAATCAVIDASARAASSRASSGDSVGVTASPPPAAAAASPSPTDESSDTCPSSRWPHESRPGLGAGSAVSSACARAPGDPGPAVLAASAASSPDGATPTEGTRGE